MLKREKGKKRELCRVGAAEWSRKTLTPSVMGTKQEAK